MHLVSLAVGRASGQKPSDHLGERFDWLFGAMMNTNALHESVGGSLRWLVTRLFSDRWAKQTALGGEQTSCFSTTQLLSNRLVAEVDRREGEGKHHSTVFSRLFFIPALILDAFLDHVQTQMSAKFRTDT